jgi:hypothetical protein
MLIIVRMFIYNSTVDCWWWFNWFKQPRCMDLPQDIGIEPLNNEYVQKWNTISNCQIMLRTSPFQYIKSASRYIDYIGYVAIYGYRGSIPIVSHIVPSSIRNIYIYMYIYIVLYNIIYIYKLYIFQQAEARALWRTKCREVPLGTEVRCFLNHPKAEDFWV